MSKIKTESFSVRGIKRNCFQELGVGNNNVHEERKKGRKRISSKGINPKKLTSHNWISTIVVQ